ncbi:hypothetical protein EDC96DRAFT_548313 [Choanephora cucurbitarum]|nr:hypothetical protein EDC96DRAFT_548313 [Choanephora cucurbitarum]
MKPFRNVRIVLRSGLKMVWTILRTVYLLMSLGCSSRGSKSITETLSTKATSHNTLGIASAISVMNMKLRESGNLKRKKVVGVTKKRKAPEDQLSVPKGTTGEHYLQFISDIHGVFRNERIFFIIMDNATIHVSEIIDSIIMQLYQLFILGVSFDIQ